MACYVGCASLFVQRQLSDTNSNKLKILFLAKISKGNLFSSLMSVLMSIETELKLSLPPKKANKLIQHPMLQSASHTTQHLYNTYFDTPNHDLLQHGVGLRVRRIGDKRLQTMKTAGTVLGGLHQRQEWEMEISGNTPDYSQFPKGALPAWCSSKKNRKKIEALFTTDFTRTTWDLSLNDGSKIEVALDQGEIKTKTASIPLNEVELELKAGSPNVLYKVALTLQKTLPLTIENKSKAARGYALYQTNSLQFQKAGSVNLNPDMTADQAFIHIIWHCLEHLQANEEMVLYGEDIEGVHQMRVALRRLRSCLSFYKSLIPKKTYAKLYKDVKWMTDVLGVARDWDVFALNLQNMQAQSSPLSLSHQLLEDLQTRVADFQERAYITVRQAMRSPDYSRLLLSLSQWLMQQSWRRKLGTKSLQRLDSPVMLFASQKLESHYQRICQQGQNFAQLNTEQRHELRIFVKEMAYGTRFFAELYPHKAVRPYAKNLSHLQDELGVLNDVNVATDLLNQAGLDENASARHFINGWYAHQHITYLTSLDSACQTFFEQKTFW
ncbi:MAG: hypothetical protein DRQ49_16895 [Gammaproteobacteria bacterium]|nr:MAG: hypothetical protein DRQ49_16895 [Gammaproteobacteria bacterium]